MLHLKKAIRRHFELVQRRRADDLLTTSTALSSTPRSRSTTTTTAADRGQTHQANTASGTSSSSVVARTHRHRHKSHQSSSERKAFRKSSPDRSLENENSKRPNRDIAPVVKNERISWRFVWRTYWLDLDGIRLTNDDKCVREYGVINHSVLRFVKKRVRDRSLKG